VEERLAAQRAAARAAMERASAELASIQPARMANSDAKALTRYLGALGLEVGPDRLSDLLVLLAVIMVEVGGGLSLAVGMALSVPVRTPAAAFVVGVQTGKTAQMLALHADIDSRDTSSFKLSGQPASTVRCDLIRLHGDLIRWLQNKGGRVQTSMRRLAHELGRSPAGVHIDIGRLAAADVLTAMPSARGTVLTLATLSGAD
jgi:hypothetical protein